MSRRQSCSGGIMWFPQTVMSSIIAHQINVKMKLFGYNSGYNLGFSAKIMYFTQERVLSKKAFPYT